MYIPDHFAVSDAQSLQGIVRQYPLGTLVTRGGSGLDANHLPFELDANAGEHGVLRAHVARANPLWREIGQGIEALVIFGADDAYVSPNWYPSKRELHRQVPTWNYRVVHVHGVLSVHDDEAYVRSVVERLTLTHEAPQPDPWKMSDAPADYLAAMLRAIVGIELAITRIVGKFKLSQNRELKDRVSLGERLKERGAVSLGQATLDSITRK